MKVLRRVKIKNPTKLKVGDRIKVKLPNESHTATAIKKEEDGMLFIFDQFLDKDHPINKSDTTEGGYEESYMRKFLQELSEEFPEKLKERMIPFDNGDTLQLLTIMEVCGVDERLKNCDGQIPYFKDRRNRIAERKGIDYECMWTSTVVSGTSFAIVDSSGLADDHGASLSLGVRPAFKIR